VNSMASRRILEIFSASKGRGFKKPASEAAWINSARNARLSEVHFSLSRSFRFARAPREQRTSCTTQGDLARQR
jgi:hypothetical protein